VWGFFLAVDLVYARILILAMIGMQFLKYILILCWILWVAGSGVGDALA
jgi:hypothetical protein